MPSADDTPRHFAGTTTHWLVTYLRARAEPGALERVLELAGETRPVEVLCDDGTWTSYAQFRRLLSLPDAVKQRADLSSLRHVIHSAAPCPVDVKRRMLAWWGNVIFEYYAASEGGGTLVTAQEWLTKPGTVGRAWPISEIAIFDDEGNKIEEPNVIGTVYMGLVFLWFFFLGGMAVLSAFVNR